MECTKKYAIVLIVTSILRNSFILNITFTNIIYKTSVIIYTYYKIGNLHDFVLLMFKIKNVFLLQLIC